VSRVTDAVFNGKVPDHNYKENRNIDAAPAFLVYKAGFAAFGDNNVVSV